MKVLVVDDDPDVLAPVARALTKEGFGVLATTTGRSGRQLAQDWSPDVLIVADALPDDTGLDVVIDVREHDQLAHVILLGRGDDQARVEALLGGADDYLDVSCSALEIAARVQSVARRRHLDDALQSFGSVMTFGPLAIDPDARTVRLDGRLVDMPMREFDLLVHLASHPGRTHDREELLQSVWNSSAEWQDSATVTEHIRRLRLKLERDPLDPKWLVTVRGAGYRFNPEPDLT